MNVTPSVAATNQTATPKPAANVQKMTVWPPAVYLGEHFALRFVLSHTGNVRSVVAPKRIGLAQVIGQIETRVRGQKLIVKIPLSIYAVQTYGVQKLPFFALSFRSNHQKIHKLWFPRSKVEIRARYAATQSFKLLDDPVLPFVKNQKKKQPSHEWRMLPDLPKKRAASSLFVWLSGGLVGLGLLMVLLIFWKRRKQEEPIASDDLYESSIFALERVQHAIAKDREGRRKQSDQVLRILRGYLHSRLSAPLCHLTAKELYQVLETEVLEASLIESLRALHEALVPERLAWHSLFKDILVRSEVLCFAPSAPSDEALLLLIQDVRRLLEAIESWKKESDKNHLEKE